VGLLYDGPVRIRGSSRLKVIVSQSGRSNFTGWSTTIPKMVKVQADNRPLELIDLSLAATDDPEWASPTDGTIEYILPKQACERGFIGKLELVFGSGTINDLRLEAQLE
jgi:hypothetical protein